MDLMQLEHFLAVADERTFTRAAERVFRTQPALSQSIKKLEAELGASLFMRDNGDVSLTEAGSLLEGYALRMLKLRDEAAHSIAQLQNLEIGFFGKTYQRERSKRAAAHGINVTESVGGGDLPESVGIVHDRGEEIDSLNQRLIGRDLIHSGVVGVIEAD